MTTKTKARKISAEDRESYPLNSSMQARVTMPIRAASALKRALDIAHGAGADHMEGRAAELYQEMYAEAMRCYKLMQYACRGEDQQAIEEFFPDA